jgi:dolichyl-diphosphooligosaccharide--protein glycosyltransferase
MLTLTQNKHSKAAQQQKSVDPAVTPSDFANSNLSAVVVLLMMMFMVLFAVHCTWVTSNAYSSPSVVLATTNHDG